MPNIIEQGDIFGRIGKAVGQGVGEQVERNQLSKGLERIAGNKDLSEVQRYAQGLRLPGFAEHAGTLIPALQRSQGGHELENANPNVSGGQSTHLENIDLVGKVEKKPYLSSYNSFQPLKNDPDSLKARAAQLYRANPNLYKNDPNIALQAADAEQKTQEASFEKAGQEFDRVVGTRLQKYGKDIDEDVIGDMREDYRKEAQAIAAGGKESASKVNDRISKDLLDFAKARTNLKEFTVPSLFGLTLSGKDAQSKLNAIRKEYADRDRLELLADDLVSKTGLSTGVADYIAFPLKDNKEINKFAQDSKENKSFLDYINPFQGSLVKGIKERNIKGKQQRTEQEIGQFVGKQLGPNDSINSIATAFNAKGYDPQLILDQIQKEWESGKISLTKRQERDLQKRSTFRATLKDIAYFAGTGLNVEDIAP